MEKISIQEVFKKEGTVEAIGLVHDSRDLGKIQLGFYS